MSSVIPVGSIIPGILELDELGLLFVFAVAGLSILIVLCAPATRLVFHYSVLTLMFLLVMVGLVAAANAVLFYVCWELAALFAWGLGRLGADPEAPNVVPFNAAGALASFCIFVALAVLVAESRSFALTALHPAGGAIGWLILIAIVLKAFGLLSESWERTGRPGFSLTAPTLVGPSLLVVGFYPYLRFFGRTGDAAAEWTMEVGWALGGLAVVAALAAIAQLDVRRVLTYGAFSQYAALLFGLSVSPGRPGVVGALFAVLGYSLAMTGLAICLSLAEEATGERRLDRMGGLAQRTPAAAVLFLLCALALVGLPPFLGFVGGGMVGTALWGLPDVRLALLWSALPALTLVYLGRLFAGVYLGELHAARRVGSRWTALAAVAALVAVLIVAGLAPDGLMAWIGPAASRFGAS